MDIEEFLAAQQESGQVESEGGFTVAVEKARQKLGKFQLEHPGFYLLKVVQAAVWGGATRIDIEENRNGLTLSFATSASIGTLDEVWAALRNPLDMTESPLQMLALGFNAGMFSGARRVSLVCWGAERSYLLTGAGDELSSSKAPKRRQGESGESDAYLFSVVKPSAGWFRSAVSEEFQAVEQYCGHCPIGIWVGGIPLRPGDLPYPSVTRREDGQTVPFPLVDRVVPDIHGPMEVALPRVAGRVRGVTGWLRSHRKPETFSLQPLDLPPVEHLCCSGAYSMGWELSGDDQVTFVHHGVSVATIRLPILGAGAIAVIPSSGLSFDLSGRDVLRNEKFEAALVAVREVWLDMIDSIEPDLERLTTTVTGAERRAEMSSAYDTCGWSCVSYIVGALLAFQLPELLWEGTGYLTASLAFLGFSVWSRRRNPVDRHSALKAQVRCRTAELRQDWRG